MKKLTMALVVGALVFSLAGIASAVDINIYGASAQVSFWAAEASAYLKDAAGAACGAATCYPLDSAGGCNLGDKTYSPADVVGGPYYHGASYFIATGTGCGLANTGGTVTIRVGSYDSADGIQSVIGNANLIDVLGCGPTQAGQNGSYRTQLNSTANNTLSCQPTILGASDVDGKTITQGTEGQLDGWSGPKSPTTITDSQGNSVDLGDFNAPGDAYGGVYHAVDTTSANSLVNDYHPVVVPFGLFANTSLKTANAAYPSGLQNLTTAQAQQIFSGGATNWSQFGLPAAAIIRCMRVAGSGTYATFDAGVMKTNQVGVGLPSADTTIPGNVGNNVWFNNTTGDMMNCINNNPGAIGFADADRPNSANTYGPLSFNGTLPNATTITNGAYERFWSLEHIFELKSWATANPNPHTVVLNLTGWAANHMPPAKANYWVNSNATNWYKAHDYTYPPLKGAYTQGTEY